MPQRKEKFQLGCGYRIVIPPILRYFRLSGVPLKLCRFILLCAVIFFICSVILGELESFRNYSTGIFVHFPKTVRLISFPKILGDLFSVPETTFLLIRKH